MKHNKQMIKKFISPNLKYKNGKVYYLNKFEINKSNVNYEHNNYFIDINEKKEKNKDYSYELFFNENDDNILVICNINDSISDENKIKKIITEINSNLSDIKNDDVYPVLI